ncbi:unnamed protein product [Arabidopsis lyrata]|nr:unnamed protein product [Arabidopsis lyrata]
MPNGSDRITSHTLQELDTKTSEDPEIIGWLALGIKKKKAKKAGEKREVSTEAEPMDASSDAQE